MTDLRDWKEDAALENGNYFNTCGCCGEQFLGHKRRTVCKVCDQYFKGPTAESRQEAPEVRTK